MNESTQRGLLYGFSAAVLGGLCYGGFVYQAEPDLLTLLGSVNVQLRMAHAMPAVDKDGHELSARENLLAEAGANLARAAAIEPESAMVAEFEGFLAGLRGEFRAAAGHYRRARSMGDCTTEQRDTLVFNEARMLARAGDPAAALTAMERAGTSVAPELWIQQAIEKAGYLAQLGRGEDATGCLQVALDSDQPVAWMHAALCFEQLGDMDRAVEWLGRAKTQVPVAEYHLARLKLAAGEVDSSLQLLERAIEAIPAEVRRLVREDPSAWRGLAENARFQQLTASGAATPGR